MTDILKYKESLIKSKKRKEIIKKSMNIFIREGIHTVKMSDIALETGISLRSLYYYYNNKQKLAVDIQIICMNSFNAFFDIELDEKDTGYEQLSSVLTKFHKNIMDNQKIIKFITAFDYHFFNSYPGNKYNKFLSTQKNNSIINKILEKGVLDNSIEFYGEDPLLVFTTVFQSMLSYSQKLIYREKAMLSEDISSKGDLSIFNRMLLSSMKKRSS